MKKVTLYSFENSDIKIDIQAYFDENNQLIIDGYDIGNRVKAIFGDSDYEYLYTVKSEEVLKLYELFNLKHDDQSNLLKKIQSNFSGNKAYSEFGKFMDDNNIKYTAFTWA